jgi:hypothetical protein
MIVAPQAVELKLAALPEPRDTISISKAAARLGISPRSLKRQLLDGVKLRKGGRLKPRFLRYPSGYRTTEAWITEFIEALTQDRLGQSAGTVADEERACRAERVLAASGW